MAKQSQKSVHLFLFILTVLISASSCGGDAFQAVSGSSADAGEDGLMADTSNESAADHVLPDVVSDNVQPDADVDAPNDQAIDTADEPVPDAAQDVAVDSSDDTGDEPDSAEEPDVTITEAGQDAKPDVVQDAVADAPQDVAVDTASDAPADVALDVICNAPPVTPLCQQFGTLGKILVYANVPIGPSKYLVLTGNTDFPGSTPSDFAWNCYGTLGNGEIACFPKDQSAVQALAIPQTKVDFQPGISTAPNSPPDTIMCNSGICSLGTFAVCNGKYEMCRVENGVLFGNAQYTPAGSEHPYIRCTIKECMNQ